MYQFNLYRENLSEFATEGKLYVPKNGGLSGYVRNLLPGIGVDPDTGELSRAGSRQGSLELIAARGEDIPARVDDCLERGIMAFGLAPDDLYDEYRLEVGGSLSQVLNTYDWFDPQAEFLRPALCLMSEDQLPAEPQLAVNRKYRLTAERYLQERLDTFTMRLYAGDTEWTVADGTNDGCVEIVYRGSKDPGSARCQAGLQVLGIVRLTDIALVGWYDGS